MSRCFICGINESYGLVTGPAPVRSTFERVLVWLISLLPACVIRAIHYLNAVGFDGVFYVPGVLYDEWRERLAAEKKRRDFEKALFDICETVISNIISPVSSLIKPFLPYQSFSPYVWMCGTTDCNAGAVMHVRQYLSHQQLPGPAVDPKERLFAPPSFFGRVLSAAAIRRCAWTGNECVELGARVNYGDKIMHEAVENGVRQIVIIGAGYDTRALRFLDLRLRPQMHRGNSHKFDARPTGPVRLIEIDQPSVQSKKREFLRAALQNTSLEFCIPGFHMLSVDLSEDNALLKNLQNLPPEILDPRLPTLYIMEGVVEYLTIAQFKNTVNALKAFRGDFKDATPFDEDAIASSSDTLATSSPPAFLDFSQAPHQLLFSCMPKTALPHRLVRAVGRATKLSPEMALPNDPQIVRKILAETFDLRTLSIVNVDHLLDVSVEIARKTAAPSLDEYQVRQLWVLDHCDAPARALPKNWMLFLGVDIGFVE